MAVKILIVEDDPQMRELIERGLEAEGYETRAVDNGVDALIAVSTEDFALAAIDVMLPRMSGFEICRRIRQTGNSLPLLLLTARNAVEDRVFGLDSGADDYLTKPFALVELSARVRALIRRDAQVDKLVLTVGALRIDSLAVAVTVDGRPLSMSPKEFALLRLLAGSEGGIVSRTRILEEVWGSTRNIDQNIVDQYVSYLRRKLEQVECGVHIVTKRGAGYLLEIVP
ncbi:MAG: response regulator transcription factor [Actinomycetota bacterium]